MNATKDSDQLEYFISPPELLRISKSVLPNSAVRWVNSPQNHSIGPDPSYKIQNNG